MIVMSHRYCACSWGTVDMHVRYCYNTGDQDQERETIQEYQNVNKDRHLMCKCGLQ